MRWCELPAHGPDTPHDDAEPCCAAPGPVGPCQRRDERHEGDHARGQSIWRGAWPVEGQTIPDAGPIVRADAVTRQALAVLLAAAHRQLDACATLAGALADDGQEPHGAELSDRLASLAGALADEAQRVTLYEAREQRLAELGLGAALGQGRSGCHEHDTPPDTECADTECGPCARRAVAP